MCINEAPVCTQRLGDAALRAPPQFWGDKFWQVITKSVYAKFQLSLIWNNENYNIFLGTSENFFILYNQECVQIFSSIAWKNF